jgi:hypothetical protein
MVNLMVYEAAHGVLQIMSSELMPILYSAIASFKLLMTKWEQLGDKHPQLKHWINIGLFWAWKYYKWMDDTNTYIITLGRYLIYE